MKIVGRIAVILAAALVVVGVALGLSQAGYLQNSGPSRGDFERPRLANGTSSSDVAQTNTGNATNRAQRFHRDGAADGFERERGHSGTLFGIVSVIQNFAIISLIVGVVVFIPRLWQGRQVNTPSGQ